MVSFTRRAMGVLAERAKLLLEQSGGQLIKLPPKPKIGILLTNTGTPSGYTYWPMRRYLSQFLLDKRIIEVPRAIWYPILYLFILPFRPFKKGKCYKAIWNTEKDESPLRTISRNQASDLQKALEAEGNEVVVNWAFRYGEPSIADGIAELQKAGCDRLVLFPLYPQYSATTTASMCDAAFEALLKQRHQMAIRTVPAYYRNAVFIDTIATTIEDGIKKNGDVEVIVLTYHGIPLGYQEKGDPYGHQCHETTELLKKRLADGGVTSADLVTSFQSRLGHLEWLKPYTEDLTVELAKSGIKKMAMVAPGFSSDCLETLEELEMDVKDQFLAHEGEHFVYIPCLNDSAAGIRVLADVVSKQLVNFEN
ncbi:hypothetical protein QR680_008342 [Steinernema hermaphroditum]|uniref:Ferrochelatase n=1 Tax=Steinernema hermaphroditum TaxID=289476 RepID=A0AA39M6V7_9BILA|nr:hypothetical protein QR680_008342 [Steinernema hermaphroditum]